MITVRRLSKCNIFPAGYHLTAYVVRVHISWKECRWILENETVRVLHLEHDRYMLANVSGPTYYYANFVQRADCSCE